MIILGTLAFVGVVHLAAELAGKKVAEDALRELAPKVVTGELRPSEAVHR